MSRHLHIVGESKAGRLALLALREPGLEANDCHRLLRGPYTGVDAILAVVLADARVRWPELIEKHRVELLYGIPELAQLIGPAPGTLASESSFAERTRFFGASMIRCMNQGIVTFLVEHAGRSHAAHGGPLKFAFDGVDEADPTTQEFVALLVRRADPQFLRVVVGSRGPLDSELATSLSRADCVAATRPAPVAEPRDAATLLRAFVDSDCTSDDPAELAAYNLAPHSEREREHDRRGDELQSDTRWGVRVGAFAYHRERGSDRRKAGCAALLEAQQFCVEVGFSAAVVDLGIRGRALVDPDEDQIAFCRFTNQAAAALVPLGRLEESMQLYHDLRRRYAIPKIHMTTSYAIAMMYTRFLTPRDHDMAVEWQNNAIALAADLPDERDRLVFGVFQDNAMALIQMHRGNLHDALTLINSGIARLDDALEEQEWLLHRSQLLYNRARLLVALGRLDEAYGDFSVLIELDPYYTDYLSERAKISRRRSDLSAAMEDYDRAASLAPPFPELYYNRGTAFDELGDSDRALAEFDFVLEMEPDDLPSRVSRAEIRIRLGDLEAAHADITEGLQIHPSEPQLLCMEGAVLLEERRFDQALEVLGLAIEQDPRYPAALINRAVAHFRLGHPASAVEDLNRALELNGDDPDILLNRGISLQADGQFSAAVADFTHAMSLPDGDLAELTYRRGRCLFEAGEWGPAQSDLHHCAEIGYEVDEVEPLLMAIDVALTGQAVGEAAG